MTTVKHMDLMCMELMISNSDNFLNVYRMMKMAGSVECCCVTLLFALTCVSAVQVLNSIKNLKKLDFGPSVPEHSLVLLYWFANTVIINHNNEIRLTFDPRNGDYSSHPYYNHENLLDPLPRAQHDYTIGNLNQGTSVRLPSYVVHPPTSFAVGNMDRIIIRVRGDRIDQVYLTQHYSGYHHHGTEYDPAHTYLITTNLLRQIREFSMGGNYQSLLNLRDRFRSNADVSYIRNTLGDLACLGLFLCIVMKRQIYFREQSRRPENRNNDESNENSSPVNNYENRGQVNNYKNTGRVNNYENTGQVNNYENRGRVNNYENRGPVNDFTEEPQNENQCLSCRMICLALIFVVILLIVIITHI
uniref:Uncharacterized protein n=1 Tax=Labrus bergylta TaxID=56723 RepID=A0A3Q3GHV3_9LABR